MPVGVSTCKRKVPSLLQAQSKSTAADGAGQILGAVIPARRVGRGAVSEIERDGQAIGGQRVQLDAVAMSEGGDLGEIGGGRRVQQGRQSRWPPWRGWHWRGRCK